MYCRHCGKEINEDAAFCSACGAAQNIKVQSNMSYSNITSDQNAGQQASYNTMCIVGLVISGLSLLINFWGIVGLVGTIVSVFGVVYSNENKEKGRELAIVGIVIGVFSIIYGLFSLFYFT